MDAIKLEGRWEIFLGTKRIAGKNLVTRAGKTLVASIFRNTSNTTRVTHAALGSNSGAPTDTQTALLAEIAGTRTPHSFSAQVGTETQFSFIFSPTVAPWSISEIGIFTAVFGGTMVARFLPPPFTIAVGRDATLSWTLNFGG